MYPMELHGIRPGMQKRAQEYIRSVDLPDTVFNRFPSMLSGGEQRRGNSRALAMDTKLIWRMSPPAILTAPPPSISSSCLRGLPMNRTIAL